MFQAMPSGHTVSTGGAVQNFKEYNGDENATYAFNGGRTTKWTSVSTADHPAILHFYSVSPVHVYGYTITASQDATTEGNNGRTPKTWKLYARYSTKDVNNEDPTELNSTTNWIPYSNGTRWTLIHTVEEAPNVSEKGNYAESHFNSSVSRYESDQRTKIKYGDHSEAYKAYNRFIWICTDNYGGVPANNWTPPTGIDRSTAKIISLYDFDLDYVVDCTRSSSNTQETWQLKTADDLVHFANCVHRGSSGNETYNATINAVLMNDIDAASKGDLVTIGSDYYNCPDNGKQLYAGAFDGNYHSININISDGGGGIGRSFFSGLQGATIQNLLVTGTNSARYDYAGGIAGYCEDGVKIKNCVSAVSILTYEKVTHNHAGIIAHGTNVLVENCAFVGKIDIDDQATTPKKAQSGVAGIANGTGTIRHCYVRATFNVEQSNLNNTIGSVGTIENCYYTNALDNVQGVQVSPDIVNLEQNNMNSLSYKLNAPQEIGCWRKDATLEYAVPFANDCYNGVYEFRDLTPYNGNDAKKYHTLRYIRTVDSGKENKWLALYVPFAIHVNQVSETYDIAEIYMVSRKQSEEDGKNLDVVVARKLSNEAVTKPNTPYFIRPKESGTLQCDLTGVSVVLPSPYNTITCATTKDTYEFTGNYASSLSPSASEWYYMNDNLLVSTSENIDPQRWYMTRTAKSGVTHDSSSAKSSLRIFVLGEDNEATEILNAELDAPQSSRGSIYSLSGVNVGTDRTSLPAGIYIQGGKKFVVK